jgi:hypothetical protein
MAAKKKVETNISAMPRKAGLAKRSVCKRPSRVERPDRLRADPRQGEHRFEGGGTLKVWLSFGATGALCASMPQEQPKILQ